MKSSGDGGGDGGRRRARHDVARTPFNRRHTRRCPVGRLEPLHHKASRRLLPSSSPSSTRLPTSNERRRLAVAKKPNVAAVNRPNCLVVGKIEEDEAFGDQKRSKKSASLLLPARRYRPPASSLAAFHCRRLLPSNCNEHSAACSLSCS